MERRTRFHRALAQRQELTGRYLTGPLAGQPYINTPPCRGHVWRRQAQAAQRRGLGVILVPYYSVFVTMGLFGGLAVMMGIVFPPETLLPGTPMEALVEQIMQWSQHVALCSALIGGAGMSLSKCF